MALVKAGAFSCVRLQVTLRDPIWQVTLRSSGSSVVLISAFCCCGPSTWNSLPDSLRDPELSLNTFKR